MSDDKRCGTCKRMTDEGLCVVVYANERYRSGRDDNAVRQFAFVAPGWGAKCPCYERKERNDSEGTD